AIVVQLKPVVKSNGSADSGQWSVDGLQGGQPTTTVHCPLPADKSNRARAECDDKFRSPTVAGPDPGRTAMPLRNLPDDRKSRAGPLDFSPDGPLKKLKNAFRIAGRHSGAAVADDDSFAHRFGGPGLIGDNLDLGRLAVARELE